MDIGERIKMLRTQQGLTLEEVGTRVGVGKSTVRKWESGQIANMRRDKIALLAKALNVTPTYLMGWKEEDAPDQRPLPAGLMPVHKHRIPILGHVAAGVPIMAEREYEEYEDDTYGISCDYVLRVEGDSMEPRVLDGDVVYVRQQPDVDDGQIAVVGVDDSVTLKVVYHLPNGLQLVSLNPKYKPMIYTQANTDYLAIIGLAVAYKRRL